MANILGAAAKKALPKAALHQANKRGWLDMKLGFALMRDRRVSMLAKLASLASGVVLTAILVAIEVPLESIVGALLPFVGVALDFAIDGIEFLIFPLIVSAIVIRWMAPKAVVDSLRR
ncbi:MAG: hypothetical protein P4L46_03440 [Fimbriimonas sp.]|nr:hypothetical protein [Fimbriimonas sp.]